VQGIYFYKMTNDGGGAPCIERGLLSLAICKPRIRVGAEPGNWILEYTANSLDPNNRLINIAKVTGKARDGEYFHDEKYVNRRDSIYRMVAGRFRWKKNALYHSEADLRAICSSAIGPIRSTIAASMSRRRMAVS
jgi:hypothetical protein